MLPKIQLETPLRVRNGLQKTEGMEADAARKEGG